MSFTGNNSRSVRLDLGLKNKDILESWISKLSAKKDNKDEDKQNDSPNKDDNQNQNQNENKDSEEKKKELDLLENPKFEEDLDKPLHDAIIDNPENQHENSQEQIEEQKLVGNSENKDDKSNTPEENTKKDKKPQKNSNIIVTILESMARFDNISFFLLVLKAIE